jgi:hypothetical protein
MRFGQSGFPISARTEAILIIIIFIIIFIPSPRLSLL